MSRFIAQPEDGTIIRGTGEVKIRKSEEIKDFADLDLEAQDESR
jgi:hypothetical protein